MSRLNRSIRLHKALQLIRERFITENADFQKLRSDYYAEFWRKSARQLGAELDDLGGSYLRIKSNKKQTFVHHYEVCLDNHLILRIAGNKHIANKLLAENGFPVPKFCKFNIASIQNAIDFLQDLNKKVVVKPSGGGGGRGVTMGIENVAQLEKAVSQAAMFGDQFLIEEEVSGNSYRLLYLGGQFLDAVRRDPPIVVGDGRSTIRELIQRINKGRLEEQPCRALSALTINFALKQNLNRQGLTLKDVPEKGKSVQVNTVVNQNSSAENHIVRHEIHPRIIEMGREIVNQLGIELAGLDIIADTLSQPLHETNGIINEINTTPGLHHHDLVAESEQKINVGSIILEYIFNKD